jgi:hypothetical protein
MNKLFAENKLKVGKYFPEQFLSEKKLKVRKEDLRDVGI